MNNTQQLSQNEKIAGFLMKGRTISAKQAQAMYKTKNLRARINDLRKSGMSIVLTQSQAGINQYKLA
jgi:hypothetical protein